jgi:phosphatidylserine/phosphatidylglycerophosphate/cardiolipin synthase-like enzyme
VILADPGWIDGNAEAAEVLRAEGVEVRFLSVLENHAKLVVADERAAFVGSENFSWTSLTRNREIGVVLTDAASTATLAGAFDADWDRAEE